MDNKRLLAGLNISSLLDQINSVGVSLWNSDPSWIPPNAPYAPDNIVLRHDTRGLHFSQWDRPSRNILFEAEPIIATLKSLVDCDVLGKIGITRMHPGEVLALHVDVSQRPVLFERFQIPLVVENGVKFIVNGNIIDMKSGEIWWFDKSVMHSVENLSCVPRIAMVIEIHSRKNMI
jgi:hypothetical protein